MDGGPDMTSSLQLWKPITRLYDKIGWIKSRSLYSDIYERETNTRETKKSLEMDTVFIFYVK